MNRMRMMGMDAATKLPPPAKELAGGNWDEMNTHHITKILAEQLWGALSNEIGSDDFILRPVWYVQHSGWLEGSVRMLPWVEARDAPLGRGPPMAVGTAVASHGIWAREEWAQETPMVFRRSRKTRMTNTKQGTMETIKKIPRRNNEVAVVYIRCRNGRENPVTLSQNPTRICDKCAMEDCPLEEQKQVNQTTRGHILICFEVTFHFVGSQRGGNVNKKGKNLRQRKCEIKMDRG